MTLFKESADTARMNQFGVQAADVIEGLADENTRLWDDVVKVSEAKHVAEELAGMLELGLEAASKARLKYSQVGEWAREKISEGKTVDQMRRVLGMMDDYGPGEMTLNGETPQANKKSSVREGGRGSSRRIKIKPQTSNGGVSPSMARSAARLGQEVQKLH